MVKEYDDAKEYEKDQKKMAKQGYEVVNVTERSKERGFLKKRVPGVKDFKFTLVVTYRKKD